MKVLAEGLLDSENTKSVIPVLFCFDSNYARCAAVATFSAHINAKSDLKFYWFTTNDVEELALHLKYKLELFGLNITVICTDTKESIGLWRETHHLTSAMYLRLIAHEYIFEEKILYLDCDTLVLTDLRDLYNVKLLNQEFAGVNNLNRASSSLIPGFSNEVYINTGVLLMNLKGLRDGDFTRKITLLYEKYEQQIVWPLQFLINKFAEGNTLLLDQRWNCQFYSNKVKGLDFNKLAQPEVSSILHFIGNIKPWQAWCNPVISNFWWKYARQTKIDDIKQTEITGLGELIALADIEHLNGNYERSSLIKTRAMGILIKKIKDDVQPPSQSATIT